MTTHDPNVPARRPDQAERGPHRTGTDPGANATPAPSANPSEHEGAVETEVGDRTGPGAGYDEEPEQEKDRGGVS